MWPANRRRYENLSCSVGLRLAIFWLLCRASRPVSPRNWWRLCNVVTEMYDCVSCSCLCAGGVINSLNVQAGQDLAVFGCGAVGLAAVMAAKYRKARHII